MAAAGAKPTSLSSAFTKEIDKATGLLFLALLDDVFTDDELA
ncbi:Uncharacterised protein [Mycobacteroides abscessus subsp. abscessus]|nr:Uncharacterised protein [Mycobacteroides abscessus subsp. abscessus]